MKPITIDQLAQMCLKLSASGNGGKYVMLTSDDERNSYHPAWEGIEDAAILGDYIDEYQVNGVEFDEFKKNCVILG